MRGRWIGRPDGREEMWSEGVSQVGRFRMDAVRKVEVFQLAYR
jgi:hypothetical protein